MDTANFPPLPQREKRERKRREETSLPTEKEVCFTAGLTLQGKARQVGAYPPNLPGGHRAAHDALLGALAPFLEGMSLQEDKGGPAYQRLWEQANAIKSQLCSLRGEVFVLPQCLPARPPMASAQAA